MDFHLRDGPHLVLQSIESMGEETSIEGKLIHNSSTKFHGNFSHGRTPPSRHGFPKHLPLHLPAAVAHVPHVPPFRPPSCEQELEIVAKTPLGKVATRVA